MEYYEHRYSVAIQIETMLADELDFTMNEYCIYKVPRKLRELNPNVYTPNVVSIGPFHHGNPQLQRMNRQKRKYCQRFIEKSEASLSDLVLRVQELEPRVRGCYSENIELSPEEFIKVILVDCCFTLEFLLVDAQSMQHGTSIKPWLLGDISWDLLLIENQLPFFVFEEIYNLAFASRLRSGEQESFWELATFWILSIEEEAEGSEYNDSVVHFTDLYRHYRLKSSRNLPERGNVLLDTRFSVTELNQAGVKFKVDEESTCFLDLKFSGGYLTIPQLKVTDHTEMIFRNMVAFEQCHRQKDSYFTDYIVFLDFLINKENDVDILVNNEIIVNLLGDSMGVATMFNGLGKFVSLGKSNTNYLGISKDLNAYCKHPWHRRMATLRRDYCNTPWKTVASIAGIVLLILTVTQTVCSILQVR